MEGLFVKLGVLLVISSVSTVKLRPLFVVLTPLTVNSLRPFVT